MTKTTMKRAYVAPLIDVILIESFQTLLTNSQDPEPQGVNFEEQDFEEEEW